MIISRILFVFVFATLALPVLANSAVDVPQVSQDAVPIDTSEKTPSIPLSPPASDSDTPDFQQEILSDPAMSSAARAQAAISANGGNTAIIVQSGKVNASSAIQNGNGNYTYQSQTGVANDLRVEQNGDDNHSIENQKGKYNHKVIIQNKNESEETTIDQVNPPSPP